MARRRAMTESPKVTDDMPDPEDDDDGSDDLSQTYVPSGAQPDLGPGYGRITESVYALADPATLYQELRDGLSSGFDAGRADYGSLTRELDQATTNTQRAVELLIDAKTRKVLFDIDQEIITAALRTRAMSALQKEKEDGKRSKQITNGDVDEALASMFPTEYRDAAQAAAEAKGTVEAIESLADRWKERTRALNTMVQTVRS